MPSHCSHSVHDSSRHIVNCSYVRPANSSTDLRAVIYSSPVVIRAAQCSHLAVILSVRYWELWLLLVMVQIISYCLRLLSVVCEQEMTPSFWQLTYLWGNFGCVVILLPVEHGSERAGWSKMADELHLCRERTVTYCFDIIGGYHRCFRSHDLARNLVAWRDHLEISRDYVAGQYSDAMCAGTAWSTVAATEHRSTTAAQRRRRAS